MQKVHHTNALHIKRKLKPSDYRRDTELVIVNPKTGERFTFPTTLIVALRAGLVELK